MPNVNINSLSQSQTAELQGAAGVTAMQTASRGRVSLLSFIPTVEHSAIAAGTSTFDCLASMQAAIASFTFNPGGGVYPVGPEIYVPPGTYSFSATLHLKKRIRLIGLSSGQTNDSMGARFTFPSGVPGIVIHTTVTGPVGGTGGDGSIIDGIVAFSTIGGAFNEEASGFIAKARCIIRNCTARGFAGHGFMVRGTAGAGGAIEGNANNWRISNCRAQGNRGDGLYVRGADANAGLCEMFDGSSNGRYGIFDDSFLGNTYVGCHSDSNGVGGVTGVPSIAIYAGKTWYVIKGQSAAASTTEPGTNAAVWGLALNSEMAYLAWISGTTYCDGGAYRSDGLNAPVLFSGCYSESGQSPAQFAPLTLAVSGIHAALIVGGSQLNAQQGYVAAHPALSASNDTLDVVVGDKVVGGSDLLRFTDTVRAPNSWRFKLTATGGIIFDYANGANASPFEMTGPTTANTFGRSAPVPYAFYSSRLFLGAGNAARQVTSAAIAPTSGDWARGDYVRNSTPAVGQPKGWICTVSGSPGTWVSEGSL